MKNIVPIRYLLLLLAISIQVTCYFRREPIIAKSDEPLVIEVGKEFIIAVDSNPTTAYEWRLATPLYQKIVQFIKTEYKPYKPIKIGSGGEGIWMFRAVGTGRAEINLGHYAWSATNAWTNESAGFIVIVHSSDTTKIEPCIPLTRFRSIPALTTEDEVIAML